MKWFIISQKYSSKVVLVERKCKFIRIFRRYDVKKEDERNCFALSLSRKKGLEKRGEGLGFWGRR